LDNWNRVLKDMALKDRHIVAAYNFEGNSNDSAGSNNGTDTNITYGTSYGKIGKGASFNGTAYIILSNKTLISATSYTIGYWFKTSSHSRNTGVIFASQMGTTNNDLFQSGISRGKFRFIRWNSSNKIVTNISTTSSYNDGNWHLVVIVFDTTNGTNIYIDGTSVLTNTNLDNNQANANDYSFGSITHIYPREPFIGDLDIAFISDEAFSASEVSELYNSGAGRQYPFTTFNPHFSRRKLL